MKLHVPTSEHSRSAARLDETDEIFFERYRKLQEAEGEINSESDGPERVEVNIKGEEAKEIST